MKPIPFKARVALLATVIVMLSLWFGTRSTDEPPAAETAGKTKPSATAPPPNQKSQWRRFSDQVSRNIEADRQAREQADRLRQTEAEAAEAERQRRENWEKNFPYQPTYHPTLTYNRGQPGIGDIVKRHGYMVAFFNNPQRFTAEFEQLYHMLQEIDRADDPKNVGTIFANLRDYHKSMRSNLEALVTKKKWVNDSQGRLIPVQVPIDGKTTWGDRDNGYSESIVSILVSKRRWPNKEPLDKDKAQAMRDRLLTEIPSENLVKMPPVETLPNGDVGGFLYSGSAERVLEPGDQLLVPVLPEPADLADAPSESESNDVMISVISVDELP